ncbi:MAG: EAL domain-containing protein [Acidimicrobiales bacterium]
MTLAIDDFGTGYSSLATLKDSTIDRIKIDRSFVTGLADNAWRISPSRGRWRSSVTTSGLRTVAEGTTADVLAITRSLGCDEFQGYLASRPVTAAELTPLLRAGRFDVGAELGRRRRSRPAWSRPDMIITVCFALVVLSVPLAGVAACPASGGVADASSLARRSRWSCSSPSSAPASVIPSPVSAAAHLLSYALPRACG